MPLGNRNGAAGQWVPQGCTGCTPGPGNESLGTVKG